MAAGGGALWISGVSLALLAADGQLAAAAQVVIALSLVLTLPLLVYLLRCLLHSVPLLAWLPSLVAGGALILTLAGFTNLLNPRPYLPQTSWFTWSTFIVAYKVWGVMFMLTGALAFWNRPGGVAALIALTGVLTYHFAGTLDGHYPDFWRLVVALALGLSWILLGVSLYTDQEKSEPAHGL